MLGFAALVDNAGSNEASGLPFQPGRPVGWRVLLDPKGRTVDERCPRPRAEWRRNPVRRRPSRRSSGCHAARPAKGKLCPSLQKGCAASRGQDRDRRYRLGADLGKCCGRALQRTAAGSDGREVGDRAACPGVAAAGGRIRDPSPANGNRAARRRSSGRAPASRFRSRRPPQPAVGGLLRSRTRRSELMVRSACPMPGASRRPADCRRRCSRRSRRASPKRRSARRPW